MRQIEPEASRLTRLCDSLLEAAWLAALIVAPLFFNVYSIRIFEPEKISLIRSIALFMLAVWIIRQIETGLPGVGGQRALVALIHRNPLLLPAGGIAIVYLISTILSITPAISFSGSYPRLQGTYTTFSYIVIALIAASSLHTQPQLNRAITTALVTSIPVALYGILQHFNLDPLTWDKSVTTRVASSMGNAIFVAAYLIMVVPLALARWIETLGRLKDIGPRFSLILKAIVYTLTFAAQLVAILFTQSRGPWLGLAAGLLVFAVLYALVHDARRIAIGTVGVAGIVLAFLVVFNFSPSPFEPLKRLPYIGRLGQVFDGESATGKTRAMIWQSTLMLVLPHNPLWSPITGSDAFNLLRPLVGYGPEMMQVAFTPFYPSELGIYEGRYSSPDRAHNDTFDWLVTTGFLGLAASIVLFSSFFYWATKWLGGIKNAHDRNVFFALWLGGGIGFALICGAFGGWYLTGVALPAGMMIGFLVFLIRNAARNNAFAQNRSGSNRTLWLCALIAAAAAHFVEVQFGIAVVSTQLYFWFCLAIMAVIGTRQFGLDQPVAYESADHSQAGRRIRRKQGSHVRQHAVLVSLVPWTAVTTLVLITLAFDFVSNPSGVTNSMDVIRRSLFSGMQNSPGAFFMLAATWAIASAVSLGDDFKGTHFRIAMPVVLCVALLPLIGLAVFMALQAFLLTRAGNASDVIVSLLVLYYSGMFLVLILFATGLYSSESPTSLRPLALSRKGMVAVPILAIILVLVVYRTNFTIVWADTLAKLGSSYGDAGAWDESINAYTRALALEPNQDSYAVGLGQAYLKKARATQASIARSEMLDASDQIFQDAQKLNPFSMEPSANLGRLHRIWATLAEDQAAKTAHLGKSSEYFQVTIRLNPNMPYFRNEWSLTHLQAGNWASALAQLEQSSKLDPYFAQTYYYLGEYYRGTQSANQAVENYVQAIMLDPNTLSDASGKLFAGPISVLIRPEFLNRTIDAYRAARLRLPNSIAVRNALSDLEAQAGK